MANRDFDRERRGRDVGYGRDYERDWDRGYYGRDFYDYDPYEGFDYDRDTGYYGPPDYGSDLTPTYNRDWWDVPGPYQGVGPRGYQRSDEMIWQDIVDRLTWHGHIDARDIDVQVNNGEVTLRGSVRTRREKRLAEDIGFTVLGVADIHNQLRVRRPSEVGEDRIEKFANRLTRGMEVVGSDGKHVGKVIDIQGFDFMLERPDGERFYVPLSFLQSVEDKAQLNLPEDQVEQQGWQTIEMTEPETGVT